MGGNLADARRKVSIWAFVESKPRLTLMVPVSSVPALSWAKGAQCSPARTAMPCRAKISAASSQSNPVRKDTVAA